MEDRMTDADLNVDNLIARLLEVRGTRPGKTVQMTEGEVSKYCRFDSVESLKFQ